MPIANETMNIYTLPLPGLYNETVIFTPTIMSIRATMLTGMLTNHRNHYGHKPRKTVSAVFPFSREHINAYQRKQPVVDESTTRLESGLKMKAALNSVMESIKRIVVKSDDERLCEYATNVEFYHYNIACDKLEIETAMRRLSLKRGLVEDQIGMLNAAIYKAMTTRYEVHRCNLDELLRARLTEAERVLDVISFLRNNPRMYEEDLQQWCEKSRVIALSRTRLGSMNSEIEIHFTMFKTAAEELVRRSSTCA